jgi:hypothetical protein
MTRPNFFIVGAPKCGTSALWHYLSSHPRIFMPARKEPHYFASDLPSYRTVHSLADYLALFEGAGPDVAAAGEASVYYMYSRTAIPNIRRFDPAAKLIAMVRNPIDMIHSFHGQLVYSQQEDRDLRTALRLQADRRLGKHVPVTSVEPSLLQYTQMARLGEQMERLFDAVPREQVLVLFFEDLTRSAKDTYEEVLRFLGVPSDGRTEFPAVNQAKKRRSGKLAKAVGVLTYTIPGPTKAVVQAVKGALGIQRFGVLDRFRKSNRVEGKRDPMPADVRAELAAELRDDVARLGRVLGRDLSHWLPT